MSISGSDSFSGTDEDSNISDESDFEIAAIENMQNQDDPNENDAGQDVVGDH